jgi:hypothetical protein
MHKIKMALVGLTALMFATPALAGIGVSIGVPYHQEYVEYCHYPYEYDYYLDRCIYYPHAYFYLNGVWHHRDRDDHEGFFRFHERHHEQVEHHDYDHDRDHR